jgi:Domain of unknown function DUF29
VAVSNLRESGARVTLKQMKSVATSPRSSARDRSSGPGYEEDFYVWLLSQAKALRERRFQALDLENLIEEVEDLARKLPHELKSRLRVIIAHMLKWQPQPAKRSTSWNVTLLEQRFQLRELLDLSPSLRRRLPDFIHDAYETAARLAGAQMKLEKSQWRRSFPAECPWTPEQILDDEYFPNGARTNGARKRG